jgi:hypothetical protein
MGAGVALRQLFEVDPFKGPAVFVKWHLRQFSAIAMEARALLNSLTG